MCITHACRYICTRALLLASRCLDYALTKSTGAEVHVTARVGSVFWHFLHHRLVHNIHAIGTIV